MDQSKIPTALKLLTESLDIADADNKYVRYCALGRLGNAFSALGDNTAAHENFHEATSVLGEPLYSDLGIFE